MTVGELESEERRSRPRTTRAANPHMSLLEEASEMVKTAASGSNVSMLSRIERSAPPVLRNGLLRDLWSVVAGFLRDDSMKPSTGRCDNLGGVPACWVWVPLKHRETVLMMYEITVCVEKRAVPAGFGLRNTRHRKYRGHGFRKGFMTRAGSVADEGMCSRRRY